jgi:hypothetical protein
VKSDIIQIDSQLHELMNKLDNAPLLLRHELNQIPLNGLYVFYEDNNPIYVGMSGKDRMRNRILEHGRPSSGHNKATFAFNIAKKECEREIKDHHWTRDNLENDSGFRQNILRSEKTGIKNASKSYRNF